MWCCRYTIQWFENKKGKLWRDTKVEIERRRTVIALRPTKFLGTLAVVIGKASASIGARRFADGCGKSPERKLPPKKTEIYTNLSWWAIIRQIMQLRWQSGTFWNFPGGCWRWTQFPASQTIVSFLPPPGKAKPLLQVEMHSFSLQTTREFIGVGGLSRQGLLFANWHWAPSKLSGQSQTLGARQKPKFWHGGIQIAAGRKWTSLFRKIEKGFTYLNATYVHNRAFCPSWILSRRQVLRTGFAFASIYPGRRSLPSTWRHIVRFDNIVLLYWYTLLMTKTCRLSDLTCWPSIWHLH